MTTTTTTMADYELFATFAAQEQDRLDSALLPTVTKALAKWDGTDQWFQPILEKAAALYEEETNDPAPPPVLSRLRTVLAKTGDPNETAGDSAERVTKWVATFVQNAATYSTREQGSMKTWITMLDDRVRHQHAELHGVTIKGTERFDVGTAKLRYPGEPVGDPSGWIQCRCVLKMSKGDAMTAAAEVQDPADVEAEATDAELVDAESEVVFHGIAAPTDKPTGDKRQLARDGFSVRNLPLPLFYQRAQTEGHGGSTIVGKLTNLSLDPETGDVLYDGTFNYTPEAGEVIQGIAEGWLRGVSVDLDDVLIDYAAVAAPAEDTSPEDMMDAAQRQVTVFSQWRVAGLTVVGIPAFQEAYIALGTREELAAKKKAPVPPVPPAEVAPADGEKPDPKKKPAPQAPAEKPKDGEKPPVPPKDDEKDAPPPFPQKKKKPAHDGETETFAPGTHDGPGWITHPVPTGRIRRYWTEGEGALKIKWGVPGDFNRCRTQLAKYIVNPEWLAGACANMHKEATGGWPGHAPTEAAEATTRLSLVAAGA